MSSSDLGWFGLGAVVGAAVALAVKKKELETLSDDKVLVVRDGSVEIFVNDSKMHKKNGTKQKWSGDKADKVTVSSGPDSGNHCDTELLPPSEFDSVVFETTSGDTFVARADSNRKLDFEMGMDKEFKFRRYRYSLFKDGAVLTARIGRVVIHRTGQQPKPFTPGSGQALCVEFK